MIERYYEDAPEQFKTAWLDENNAKGIIIKFIDYKRKVTPAQGDNPSVLGWYEHNDKAKKYILTTDTTVIENKRYFEQTSDLEALTYTDQTIENDSFKLKKSLQSGSAIDFMGCISSSLEFKVENDFKYLKDQKLYSELTVTVLAGTQIITGPLGVFKVGTTGYIPAGWNTHLISNRNEILEFGEYNTQFFIIGEESHPIFANEYLERCDDNDHRGLEARIEIPSADDDTLWKIRVFTGIVEEIKRDKSRDLVRTITAYDFLHRLLDNYDVTDWYVWQYGEGDEGKEITHSIYDLRNTFWDYIANTGTVLAPDHTTVITKKGEGWDQVQNAHLINDNIWIPKTLDVSPIKYDEYVGGALIGGPFRCVSDYIYEQVTPIGTENPHDEGWYNYVEGDRDYVLTTDTTVNASKLYYKHIAKADYDGKQSLGTQYMAYNPPDGIDAWETTDLVARNQIIQLGAKGTLFTYTYKGSQIKDTNFREYLDHCDTLYEEMHTPNSGIVASIKIPVENQDKVRETQITAATVLQAFCQFNGVFGQCDGYGRFDYVKLDTQHVFEILEDYQIEVGTSDIELPNITSVVIFDKTSEEYTNDMIHTDYGDVKNGKKGSALAYYPNDTSQVYGFNANPYIIDDNFLMNAFKQEDAFNMAKNLYENISALTMRNSDITIKSMPWLKNGETICYYIPSEDTLYPSEDLYPSPNLYPSGYQRITTLVMTQEITGTGLFKHKIECKAEELSGDIVSLNEVISAEMFMRKIGNDRSFSRITQESDRIELYVQASDKRFSKIEQTTDDISFSVVNLEDSTSAITTEIILTKDRIALHSQNIEMLSNNMNIVTGRLDLQAEEISVISSDIHIITQNGVTFEDLASGGKTTINGANITTGTISCSRIGFGSVTVDHETHDVQWTKLEGFVKCYKDGQGFHYGNMTTVAYINPSTSGTNVVVKDPITGDDTTIRVLTVDDLLKGDANFTYWGVRSSVSERTPIVLYGGTVVTLPAILTAEPVSN